MTMAFQEKLPSHSSSDSYQAVMKLYKAFASILHTVICSDMNTASIRNKRKGLIISSCFLWELFLFIVNNKIQGTFM